jgi:hypothetical protein
VAKRTNAKHHRVPDLVAYHQTLATELKGVQDRIRNLVPHYPTDGAFKEAALRSLLRRHLPETMHVGRGFVVTDRGSSSEIDILVTDRDSPTLFKDGDLVIVTPDAVRAIVEVKTSVKGIPDLRRAIKKVAENQEFCRNRGRPFLWSGLYIYNELKADPDKLLMTASKACQPSPSGVSCIVHGSDTLVEFTARESDAELLHVDGLENDDVGDGLFVLWHVPKLAPTYFLGRLLRSLTFSSQLAQPTVWFPTSSECRPVRCLALKDRSFHDVRLKEPRPHQT